MKRALGWVCASRTRQVCILILLGCILLLPGLGATGFSMSEGHRVVPAWEMLDDARAGESHWLVPRMFGTIYLRKPPGALWAIAASSAVLGETEFAARLPGAISMLVLVLGVWYFTTRWFGSPYGMASAAGLLLLPALWPSARSAEIEPMHIFATGLATLTMLDCAVGRAQHNTLTRRWLVSAIIAILSIALSLWIKGPAGVPFFLGVVVGCPLALHRIKPSQNTTHRPSVLGPFFALVLVCVCGLVLGGVGLLLMLRHATRLDEPMILQSVGDFLFEPNHLPAILTLVPVAWASLLPASLGLLFVFGPDIARERTAEALAASPGAFLTSTDIARMLGFSALAALMILALLGVSNPRYALPACALLVPLVGYIVRGMEGAFVPVRAHIARVLLLGSPLAWPVLLIIAGALYVGVLEPRRRSTSGRDAGIALASSLASSLPDGAMILADNAIEARPEILLYAVRRAAAMHKAVHVRWIKPIPTEPPPAMGTLLFLREDALEDELAPLKEARLQGRIVILARARVHKYAFVLCSLEPNLPVLREPSPKPALSR